MKKDVDKAVIVSIIRNMSNYRNNQNIDPDEDFANAFKALSNSNRLKIFQRLINCCNPGTRCSSEQLSTDDLSSGNIQKFCVGDLGENLDVSASTLSHHMKELNRAGLIEMQRRGQHIDCWVEPETINKLRAFFETQSSS